MEAAATLPPADRALLNLWVNRGLDDTALAGLLGMSQETIASRRARIVEHLSATLGLPPDHVLAALSEITVASGPDNGDAAVPGPPVAEAAAARTAAEPEAVPARRRRRRVRWWALGLTLVAIAAVCILSCRSPRAGPDAAGVLRRRASPRRQQTPASGGHYQIWLYNSLTNSLPLGRLRAGVDHLSLPLPRGAARYRWIDISLQPVGTVFHSGESRLRADPRSGTSGP